MLRFHIIVLLYALFIMAARACNTGPVLAVDMVAVEVAIIEYAKHTKKDADLFELGAFSRLKDKGGGIEYIGLSDNKRLIIALLTSCPHARMKKLAMIRLFTNLLEKLKHRCIQPKIPRADLVSTLVTTVEYVNGSTSIMQATLSF